MDIVFSSLADDKALVPYSLTQQFTPSLDDLIAAWLHEKYGRSQSTRTRTIYEGHMASFRALLRSIGHDLDSDPSLIAMLAQGWAAQGYEKDTVSASTFNGRVSSLSSFYRYAMKRRQVKENPMAMLDHRPVQSKDYALPLEKEDVQARLKAIDTGTLSGKRDYALLAIALSTGRRASELAAMRYGDITFTGSKVVVCFPRCKGGKVMTDELSPKTAQAFVTYLLAVFGSLESIPPEHGVWLSFARNASAGGSIGIQAISDICKKRLGCSKVHATRHSFAVAMEQAGASLSDIGHRLGHSSLSTTSDYLARLHSSENAFAIALDGLFGIGQ